MGNDHFQFKQFRIQQARSAMRISTDACILGAWVARHYPTSGRVLDIGSGTGLLMLMMAQQMTGSFTGVEFDQSAYQESGSNIDQSPWAARIKVINEDIRTFESDLSFDLIVSNPPFYHNDLKRPDAEQNLAMHSAELSLAELVSAIDKLLSEDGHAIVLLPPHRSESLVDLMKKADLFENRTLTVRHSRSHRVLRKISVFSRKKEDICKVESLDIRESNGAYTDAFTELMKPYYLFL